MRMRRTRPIRNSMYGGVLLGLAFLIGFLTPPNVFAQVGAIDFQQCQNDQGNTNSVQNCVWVDGGINANNGFYKEGDAVPQRLFIQVDTANPHTLRFMHDFSRADIYAYDFLTDAKAVPQNSDTLLNPCANLPNFVLNSGACTAAFFTAAATATIPPDLFDTVSAVETGTRQFRVACSPGPCTGVSVTFPSLDGGGVDLDPGESHDPDSDPDCFQDCGNSTVFIDLNFTTPSADTLVAVWFAGHLALGNVAGGWGTGCDGGTDCGASSISGAPFSIQLSSFDPATTDTSLGNRTNQLQGGILPSVGGGPTGFITVIKQVIGQAPGSPWEFSISNSTPIDPFTLPAAGGTLSFGPLEAGTYIISETGKAGFTSSVSCDPQASTTTSTSAEVEIDDNEVTCTFINTGPPVEAIPTLSEWGMIGMALLLAAVALWYLRSRSVLRT